jgi:hypothetical protein
MTWTLRLGFVAFALGFVGLCADWSDWVTIPAALVAAFCAAWEA